MKNMFRLSMLCLVAGSMVACQNDKPAEPAVVKPAAKAEEKPATKPATNTMMSGRGASYIPAVDAGWNRSRLAFPTGEIPTSAVMLDLLTPATARVGSNYEYQIHVTNLTNGSLQNVVVNNENFKNLGMVSATPATTSNGGGKALWNLGDFAAGETKVIRVTAKADAAGLSSNCLGVTYTNALCGAVTIVEPKLELTKAATPEVLVCDNISIKYVATNKGTGTIDNVVIRDTLASGLTVDGKTSVELPVGTLTAGQSAERTVIAKANGVGKFESPAAATGSGDIKAASTPAATLVKKPVLEVACSATEGKVFVGRDVTFTVTVKNTSNVSASDSVVTATLPTGGTLVSASDGGLNKAGLISWNLGAIAAGQERKLTFTVKPAGIGSVATTINAMGTCVDPKQKLCSTDVVGIPALLLDGKDDPDPVVVGGNVVYTLTVTNQGSATLTNVKLVCTSVDADSMQYVTSTGPTAGTVTGNSIAFAPIATLAPKESRTYTVTIKALKEGQVSFKAEAESAEITRKLIKTETTNFFK